MATFMNEHDLAMAIRRFGGGATPNRLRLAETVDRLREWADYHSDGWAYWQKPRHAAAKAVALIYGQTFDDIVRMTTTDADDIVTAAAIRPIKTFCTRQVNEGHMTAEDRTWILERI